MSRLKPPNWVGFDAGAHMTDKHRQRQVPTPHGFLPNWVLVLFGAGAILVVHLAQSLI
ncbi:MAG TPA: hypothetical protein VHQ87_11590 [Rhizobacter sp.]|nr:hypothetical protein [Rhizobacter sp.]